MGTLEQVVELKQKGIPENEIVADLKEQGIPPKAIMDALEQAKIKNAISSEETSRSVPLEGMQHSIMGSETEMEQTESLPTEGRIADEDLLPPARQGTNQKNPGPSTREISSGENIQSQIPSYQNYPPAQFQNSEEYLPASPEQQNYSQYDNENYTQQNYGNEYSNYDYPQTGEIIGNTDTIIEIAEQVFFEKIKKIQKNMEELNEFKTINQTKIENISDRLKRIESSLDILQSEILERVGSYGGGLESVKKELSMMQDSFGKVINSVLDSTEKKHSAKSSSSKRKVSRKR